jgi:hypothetical protein
MADITTRAGKGSPLTNNEVDANFTNLNTDKAENGANSDITSLSGITGGISAADYVDFDVLASAVSRATGRLTWNSSDGCLEVGLIGSDVTQQIGQEMLARVYNADTGTISNGEVVYFHSTAGEIIAAKKYIANGTIDPHLIVGLATEDIAAGAYGYVTEFGFVRGLDTAAFNPGDILFASPSTAGAIQSNEPSTPNDVVRMGICLESDSTNGIVLVNPHDVPRADEIRYDNADSDLTATNVKSAIDELDLVKADIDLLTSNVTFYLTNANDAILTGYKQLVTSTLDTNYDEVAVDYLASGITATAGLIQAWVSDVNVLVGDIAGIVVPIVFNVRKDTGSGDARFYLEVYIRDSLGVETLITTTNVSDYVTSTIYTQLSLSATISLQTFTDTDQVVLKLYGQTGSNTADYEFQLGGASPFRSLFPVPVSVVPSVANAYAIVADTTNFDDKLSSADDTVQKALETLDDHVHQASEITGLTASNTDTNTSQFNGHLSAADDDVQKALNTLDEITLDEVAAQNGTTTQNITINAQLNVDNLRLDGNAITSTDTDGNIALTPNGTGEVDISKVDIDSGAIDGTTIGGTTPGAGTFTDLTVNTTATFAGATIADLGTVTTANIDGGTIDGVTLDATIADIDNIRIDGNSITSTNGNGDISITPNGLGEVNISKVDIDAGAIDGTTIGATSAAAGNFTTLDVATSASFAGASIDDLGTVATADINGGTIDGADITVGTGKTLSVINGTLTLADNQISGDKVHGGIISNFASIGIDDNATSTAITIDSSQNTTFSGTINSGDITVSDGTPFIRLQDSDITNGYTQIANTNGNGYIGARNDTANGIFLVGGYGGGTFTEWARWSDAGNLTQRNNLIVQGTFTSLGIDDNATSTAITITGTENVGIGNAAPDQLLDVGDHTAVGNRSIRISQRTATSALTYGGLEFYMDNTAGTEGVNAAIKYSTGSVRNHGELTFHTGNAASTGERVRINYAGLVGINEDDPQTLLHLSQDTAPIIRLERDDTTLSAGNGLGQIQFAHKEAGYEGVSATLRGEAGDALGSGMFVFQTGLANSVTDRMYINEFGLVTIDPTGGGDQITHELSVRNNGSPRLTIDHLNGTGSAVSSALLFRYSATTAGSIGYLGDQDLAITNNLSAGDIIYETPTEHSFTIAGVEEVKITNTETNIYGASGDILVLNDTNAVASATNIGNVRIGWDDSAGTRVAYIGTVNSDDFYINNQYSQVVLTYAGSAKAFTRSAGWGVTGTIEASGAIISNGSGLGNAMFQLEEVGNNPWNIMQFTGGDFSIQYNSTSSAASSLCVKTDGKIGLGTVSPQRELAISLDDTTTTTLGQKGGIELYSPSGTVGNGGEIIWSSQSGNTETWCAISGHIKSNNATGSTGDLVFATKGVDSDTSPTERIRILSTGGLTFNGETTAAHALDDYEEGTFDVEIFDAGTGGNKSATTTTGYYTKIGRVVTMNFYALNNIDTTGMTSGNPVFFSLPFTAGSTGRHIGNINAHGLTYAGDTGYQSLMIQTTQSASRGYLVTNGYGRADASVKVSDISSGADDFVTLTMIYHV